MLRALTATLQQDLWSSLLKFAMAVTTAFILASLGILIFLPLRLLQRAGEAGA